MPFGLNGIKYHKRTPHDDLSFLFPTPRPPKLQCKTAFISSMKVKMFIPGGMGQIYYTLDGSEPDKTSLLYEEPFTIMDMINQG